jgi:hypothetical protein
MERGARVEGRHTKCITVNNNCIFDKEKALEYSRRILQEKLYADKFFSSVDIFFQPAHKNCQQN